MILLLISVVFSSDSTSETPNVELCSHCEEFDSLYNSVPCWHGFCYRCATSWKNYQRCNICKKGISFFLHKLHEDQGVPLVDMPVRLIPLYKQGSHVHIIKEYENESRFIRHEVSYAKSWLEAIGCS